MRNKRHMHGTLASHCSDDQEGLAMHQSVFALQRMLRQAATRSVMVVGHHNCNEPKLPVSP
eukprot:334537-Pelagomonas_calceolata.AAC.3